VYHRESSQICIARAISLLILSLFLIAIATDLQSSRMGPTMFVENSPQNPEVPLGDVESDDDAPNPVMAESTLLLSAPRILTLASQTRDLAAVQVTQVTVLRLWFVRRVRLAPQPNRTSVA